MAESNREFISRITKDVGLAHTSSRDISRHVLAAPTSLEYTYRLAAHALIAAEGGGKASRTDAVMGITTALRGFLASHYSTTIPRSSTYDPKIVAALKIVRASLEKIRPEFKGSPQQGHKRGWDEICDAFKILDAHLLFWSSRS